MESRKNISRETTDFLHDVEYHGAFYDFVQQTLTEHRSDHISFISHNDEITILQNVVDEGSPVTEAHVSSPAETHDIGVGVSLIRRTVKHLRIQPEQTTIEIVEENFRQERYQEPLDIGVYKIARTATTSELEHLMHIINHSQKSDSHNDGNA